MRLVGRMKLGFYPSRARLTEAVYRRYDIVAPQDLKNAAEKMEFYLGKVGGQIGPRG